MIYLQSKAKFIREEVLRIALKNKCGHIAPSLSTVEILTTLYYGVMLTNYDYFILSKAHGCYALYAILADLHLLPQDQWENFGTDKSELTGCASYKPEWGIEAGCGSLGHGLPMAVGLAFGLMKQKKESDVFVMVGDGELQEGSNWEAIEFAVRHNLDLCIIIDANGLQAMNEIPYTITDIEYRLSEFGCEVIFVDGHDVKELYDALRTRNKKLGWPLVYLCRTVKGKGLPCMENEAKFHYRLPGCIVENI